MTARHPPTSPVAETGDAATTTAIEVEDHDTRGWSRTANRCSPTSSSSTVRGSSPRTSSRDDAQRKPIDLTADLHGHVHDYISDLDRRWFDDHWDEDRHIRIRPPYEHELCDGRFAVEGRCVPLLDVPPGYVISIEVEQLAPGVRVKRPFLVKVSRG